VRDQAKAKETPCQHGRPRWRPSGSLLDRRGAAGEIVHRDAQLSGQGQRVGQAWVDPTALHVDEPALRTPDQMGEARLRQTAPQPVRANPFTDRRSHGW